MELLDVLHARLLSALPPAHPSADLSAPVETTIGEIYQRLVPYRELRREVGVMELAEYEHVLLRLLGGERRLVELRDAAARDDIRRELASPNPILGIYQDYAHARVELAREVGGREANRGAGSAEGNAGVSFHGTVAATTAAGTLAGAAPFHSPPSPAPSAPPPPAARADDSAPPARVSAFPPSPRGAPAARPPAGPACAPSAAPPPSPVPPAPCIRCRQPQPGMAGARFCPHCGCAQGEQPCTVCGTTIEAGWRFCARCGVERARPRAG